MPLADAVPEVTVIVPAYRAEATLSRCIDALLAQRTSHSYEVILAVSADSADELPELPDPCGRLRVLSTDRRVPAARNRNRAAAVARGDILAFTDADVVVPASWIDAVAEAVALAPDACIAGAVRNGTRSSAAGTVEYVVEFLDVAPTRPARTAWHGVTANLAMSRQTWVELGPFVENLEGGEDTILTRRAARLGRLRFRPEIIVTHLNRSRWRTVLAHHYAFGRKQAHIARSGELPKRAMAHRTSLAPLAAVARIVSIYARLVPWGPDRLRGVLVGPGVVVACGCYGAGLLVEGRRIDRADAGGRMPDPAGRMPDLGGRMPGPG